MQNSRFTYLAVLTVLFASGSAVGQSKFEVTGGFGARIRLEGKVKEALAFFEAQAREAEKKEQWADASRAYYGAMIVARSSGQLQKAIDYGAKAVETAEKTRDPALRILAANQMARIYADVRNFDRAREFLEKAFLILKELPPNSPFRHRRQSVLYSQLGADLMRRQEYEKAIDAFSQAHYLARVYLSSLGPRPQRTVLETARFDLLDRLRELGDAYRQAGKLDEALLQYHSAFESIKELGLRYPSEGNLYEGTGEIYFQQQKFSLALAGC
jgi:tetratricopeptide (TPR) repeat protein